MFADPQTVTLDTVAKTLPKVSIGSSEGVFRTADGAVQLRISHQESKGRKRHMVRIDNTVVAADPLTAENAMQKAGVYLVIDEPSFGFDDNDLALLIEAFTDWFTPTNWLKVLGGES